MIDDPAAASTPGPAPGDVSPSAADRWRRAGRYVMSVPSRYRVSLLVLLAPTIATALARWILGSDPSRASIELLGYGWPTTFEEGRIWTLITGAFVSESLVVSFGPSFSLVGVVLLEHKARHWRAAAVFLGGQVLGVLLALLITAPLLGRSGAFAHEMTETVDFGFSVGGFAALGAWTCYLRPSWERPLRWGVSCYLACMLLFSGLIFDVSHPIGWILGVLAGRRFQRDTAPSPEEPASGDDQRIQRIDVVWICVAVAIGTTAGILAAWDAGGIGGVFGWGPGA